MWTARSASADRRRRWSATTSVRRWPSPMPGPWTRWSSWTASARPAPSSPSACRSTSFIPGRARSGRALLVAVHRRRGRRANGCRRCLHDHDERAAGRAGTRGAGQRQQQRQLHLHALRRLLRHRQLHLPRHQRRWRRQHGDGVADGRQPDDGAAAHRPARLVGDRQPRHPALDAAVRRRGTDPVRRRGRRGPRAVTGEPAGRARSRRCSR